MELTRKQLESVLVAHHRIHPDKQNTFLSRVKGLQRIGFPPGTNVGRGPKMSYTAEHLMMLVTAFELQQIGLPAERATITLKMGWNYLKTGYGVAFGLQDQFAQSQEKILAQIVGRTLMDLQFQRDPPLQHEGIPFALAITASEVQRQLSRRATNSLSNSYVLLDISNIIRSVRIACVDHGGVSAIDFGLEFWKWAEHQSGYIRGGNPLKVDANDVYSEA